MKKKRCSFCDATQDQVDSLDASVRAVTPTEASTSHAVTAAVPSFRFMGLTSVVLALTVLG